jgi:hypothetical protein
MERVLGPKDPDTLDARDELAGRTGEAVTGTSHDVD